MLNNNRMNQNIGQAFKKVFITKLTDRCYRYECDNQEGYIKELKQNPAMCEVIGEYGQQIKPVFDVDAYGSDIDIQEVKKQINSIFPNKNLYIAKREPRKQEKQTEE